jgi:hypothetical protein
LFDGPDVWEVIAALHALRDEDPTRHGEALNRELRTVTGLTTAQVAAALDYYTVACARLPIPSPRTPSPRLLGSAVTWSSTWKAERP